ncbi:MAG: hypothetical protein E7185_10575 [Erysipelotrichaceae bacterium]|nr:hypothetical protein [Erysipelotrichaceae bacterium]
MPANMVAIPLPVGEITLDYIRGRGNYTWKTDPDAKRPYKIKFEEKQDLFGMGADKEWALLANAEDETLMKNRIILMVGGQLGFRYTPQMIPVDIVMIGSESGMTELGSYCLSELVSLKRLGVPDAKMIAVYYEMQNLGEPFFTTDSGLEIKYDDPKEEDEHVRDFVNDLEATITEADHIDEAVHAEIAAKMDMKSTADYWWVQEFFCNGDAFGTDSTYMYLDPNDSWKLYWGPLWDFDLSMYDTSNDCDGDSLSGFNNTMMLWTDQLRNKDPLFCELLKERWNGSSDPDNPGMNQLLMEITRDGGRLDQMKEQIRSSWNRNHELWNVPEENMEETDLDTALEKLRTWIEKRRLWVCDHLDQIGNVYFTVTYTADGNTIGTEQVRSGSSPTGMDAPDKEGYLFIRWQKKDSREEIGTFLITQDTELEAVYVSEEEAVKPEAVFFARSEDWADLDEEEYWKNYETVIPEDAVPPKTVWTSSDESTATVSSEGTVTLLSEGDTVITVMLDNGLSASYVLHVYDADKVSAQLPESISAVPQNLTLKVGETGQIGYSLLPDGGVFRDYYLGYGSDADDIVKVDEGCGIVTGLKPGTANVTLYLYTNRGELTSTAECTVTVVEE